MTEITVDSKLVIFCVFILLWVFSLGIYLQAHYNVGSIEVPNNMLYCVLGGIMGVIIHHFYYFFKGVI